MRTWTSVRGILLLLGVVALLAAACGGSSSSADTSSGTTASAATGTSTVTAGTWIASVCTALGTWQKTLTTGTPDLSQLSDLSKAKDSVTGYLAGVVTATQTFIADVKAAGVPDVQNGDAIAAGFQDALASTEKRSPMRRSSVEGLSTADPTSFASGLSQVGGRPDVGGFRRRSGVQRSREEVPGRGSECGRAERTRLHRPRALGQSSLGRLDGWARRDARPGAPRSSSFWPAATPEERREAARSHRLRAEQPAADGRLGRPRPAWSAAERRVHVDKGRAADPARKR